MTSFIMKTTIEKAVEYFGMKDYFTSEDLWDFWRKMDSDLNRNAFYRRVNRLKDETGLAEICKNTWRKDCNTLQKQKNICC